MMKFIAITFLISCSNSDPANLEQVGNPPPENMMEEQAGVQHPPIPPDNPAWENLSDRFHNSPQYYGEFNWEGVAMRVLGHMAHAYRDLAQWQAMQGDLSGAAELYSELAERLSGIPLQEAGDSDRIRDLYVTAAVRDAALVSGSEADVEVGPVAGLRRELIFAETGSQRLEVATRGISLMESPPWAGVDIASFADFEHRHALRVTLTELALDAVDPFTLGGSWGYWTPSQSTSAVMAIVAAAEQGRQSVNSSTSNGEARFSASDLGWLPTGDIYIDTAGEPGPMAIGTLQRLGLDDPEYRSRLDTWSNELNQSLSSGNPEALPEQIASIVEELNQYSHGSRFYNIKQVINSGVRQAAIGGHFGVALEIMQQHRPLHAQDWACPNRLGIQYGIEGRLQLLAGDESGVSTLRMAITEGERWLGLIERERR
jgi:hypothetical protein